MGKASQYIPALKFGHKIYPEDIAGMLGLPHVGKIFYVDPTNGDDTANDGRTQEKALKTITVAYNKTTSFKHDVVVIVPGGTAGTVETAALTWSNSYTHLVGSVAPTMISQRARVGTATAALSPLITFSGNGNIVSNVQFSNNTSTGYYTVAVTGDRNYFSNVHFAGPMHATAGDTAAAAGLLLQGAGSGLGGGENTFEDCVIGLDTTARSTTNAALEMANASSTGCRRNIFKRCIFPAFVDNAGALFVKIDGSADIDRFVWFKDCLFLNAVQSTSTTMTAGFAIHATVGGTVILDGCGINGATDWANNYTNLYGVNMPDITAGNAGFMEQIAT